MVALAIAGSAAAGLAGSAMQGSKGNTSTTTAQQGPPSWLQAYLQQNDANAAAVAGMPLQQYSGPLVAGFTGMQNQAFQGVQNAQGLANPYINSAAQYAAQSATPINVPGSMSDADIAGYRNQGYNYLGQGVTGGMNAANTGGNSALTAANTGLGAANTGAGRAYAAADAGAPGAYASNLQAYYSPYVQNVVDATQNQYNNQNEQERQRVVGNAVSQGAWGGDRAGIAEAELANQQQLAQAPVIAGLYNTGYGQAGQQMLAQQQLGANTGLGAGQLGVSAGNMGVGAGLGYGNLGINAGQLGVTGGQDLMSAAAAQQQMGIGAQEASGWLAANAGTQMGALGQQAHSNALTDASALYSMGSQQQNLAQQQYNVDYGQFNQRQAFPYQTTNWLSGIYNGTNAGGTSSTTQPGPSLFSQALGAGTAGLGLYNAFNSGVTDNYVAPNYIPYMSAPNYSGYNTIQPYAAGGAIGQQPGMTSPFGTFAAPIGTFGNIPLNQPGGMPPGYANGGRAGFDGGGGLFTDAAPITGPAATQAIPSADSQSQIDALYQSVLGRAADPTGEQYWANQLGSGNASLGDIKNTFLNSSEYGQNHAAPFAGSTPDSSYTNGYTLPTLTAGMSANLGQTPTGTAPSSWYDQSPAQRAAAGNADPQTAAFFQQQMDKGWKPGQAIDWTQNGAFSNSSDQWWNNIAPGQATNMATLGPQYGNQQTKSWVMDPSTGTYKPPGGQALPGFNIGNGQGYQAGLGSGSSPVSGGALNPGAPGSQGNPIPIGGTGYDDGNRQPWSGSSMTAGLGGPFGGQNASSNGMFLNNPQAGFNGFGQNTAGSSVFQNLLGRAPEPTAASWSNSIGPMATYADVVNSPEYASLRAMQGPFTNAYNSPGRGIGVPQLSTMPQPGSGGPTNINPTSSYSATNPANAPQPYTYKPPVQPWTQPASQAAPIDPTLGGNSATAGVATGGVIEPGMGIRGYASGGRAGFDDGGGLDMDDLPYGMTPDRGSPQGLGGIPPIPPAQIALSGNVPNALNPMAGMAPPPSTPSHGLATSPWMALAQAGLGMMASRSPFPGVAIGEGGMQGLKTLEQQQELESETGLRSAQTKKEEADAVVAEINANQLKRKYDYYANAPSLFSNTPAPSPSPASKNNYTPEARTFSKAIGDASINLKSQTQPAADVASKVSSPSAVGAADTTDLTQRSDAMRQRADELYRLGDVASAIKMYDSASATDPRVVGAKAAAEAAGKLPSDIKLKQIEEGLDVDKARRTLPYDILKGVATNAGRPQTVGPNQTVTSGVDVLPDNVKDVFTWAASQAGMPGTAAPGKTGIAPVAAPPATTEMPAADQPQGGLVRNPDGSVTSIWNPYTEDAAKKLSARKDQALTAAADAQKRDTQLNIMEKAFDDLQAKGTNTGYAIPALGATAAIAKSLGIDTSKIPGLPSPESVSDIQTAGKVQKGLMGEILRSMYPNRITNMDIIVNKGIAPGVDVDPTANKNLIAGIRAQNEYDKKFSTDYLDYESKHLTDPLAMMKFENQFYKQNGYGPLTGTFFSQTPEGATQSTQVGIPSGLSPQAKHIGHTADGAEVWEDNGKQFKVKP